jgi:drug/metabolite transporter (DMT)-like permease
VVFITLAILCNALIGLTFRYFGRWGVDTFSAIVINYWVCVLIGLAIYGTQLWQSDLLNAPWWPFVLSIGVIFIIGFNVIAITVQFYGMTFTTLMQKMSLIVTAIFGILVFNESSSLAKWIGIALAIPSIYLLNYKPQKGTPLPEVKKMPWFVLALPFLTLMVNALIDSTFLSMDALDLYDGTDLRLVTYIFFVAALVGAGILAWRIFHKKSAPTQRELKAGLLLGVINYGSIYFILLSLNSGWEGSTFYPMVNVGIIGCTALLGQIFFKESLSPMKWLGFGIAIVAIALIS